LKNTIIAIILLIATLVLAEQFCLAFWPDHVEHSNYYFSIEEVFAASISFAIHIGVEIFFFLMYCFGYANISKTLASYRINKGVQKPW
jgi:hypothetical protein